MKLYASQSRCTDHSARSRRGASVARAAAGTAAKSGGIQSAGSYSVQGTVRKRNEDRLDYKTEFDGGKTGLESYAAVFDGHGGTATAEWLQANFDTYIKKHWRGSARDVESSVSEAFRKADSKLLQPKGGFFGALGERGVGGSKCGSTAAVALLFSPEGSQQRKLVAANVGDARVLLIRGQEALQLTEDHVPDSEEERKRIESTNPNPKKALVRYVAKTWRVGGLLALSRAFGDAYLKGSGQYEGVPAGSDGYSSGFGVIADPYITVTDLTAEDSWLILATDGLFANIERGGGGGLTNQSAADACLKLAQKGTAPDAIAEALATSAQQAGSTDDVTVVVLQLR